MGKLFGKIIQERPQSLAETVLPESQCGFRAGRGCIDMIFMARQLVEKAIEHKQPLYSLFIDLRKVYDSIPRRALWLVLEKLECRLRCRASLDLSMMGMLAVVRLGSTKTDSISVQNGLRQGCTLAPVLFNLYYSVL